MTLKFRLLGYDAEEIAKRKGEKPSPGNSDLLHDQHYLSESSHSLTNPNYLQNQGSNLVSITETYSV